MKIYAAVSDLSFTKQVLKPTMFSIPHDICVQYLGKHFFEKLKNNVVFCRKALINAILNPVRMINLYIYICGTLINPPDKTNLIRDSHVNEKLQPSSFASFRSKN